jgi:type IV pilus assembly protein PilX
MNLALNESLGKRHKSLGDLHTERQRGVVLVIALIVLVAMTLASIAMVRSVDTSTVVAGNLAFKQSATTSGDAGIEAALAWLGGNGPNLENDSAANGYYATSQNSLDLTGNKTESTADNLSWSSSGIVKKLAVDAAGNQVSYVIHRMCDSAGPLNGATCATEQTSQTGSSSGALRQMTTYQPGSWGAVANQGYYRITVRIEGPRSNISYVQAIVSR